MRGERRNYSTRAEATRLVIATLLGAHIGTPAEIRPTGAAERILKALAIRGLVKKTAEGWVPTAALKAAAIVQPASSDEPLSVTA